MTMSKAEVQEVIREMHKKIVALEDKLHNKNLEYDRILYQKMKSGHTVEELKKMHNKLQRIYEARVKLATEITALRKEKDAVIDNWRLSQLL